MRKFLDEKVEKEPNARSICWDCKRSAAPVDFRCSWDENLTIPEGAEYVIKSLRDSKGKYIESPVIIKCPLFLPLDNIEGLIDIEY